MLALVPSTRPLALTCQYCVAPDHTWEIDGPGLRLTGEVRFVCTVCLELVEPEPEPAGAAA